MTKHSAVVNIVNKTGDSISEIKFLHRYDSDVYNHGDHQGPMKDGAEHHICDAVFWTGFLRVGVDYWWIQFKRNSKTYTCKANFYCSLMSKDGSNPVSIEIHKDKMKVIPHASSACSVSLYEPYLLMEQLENELLLTGIAIEPHAESAYMKCNCD